MSKYKLVILTNETEDEHILWEKACIANPLVDYRIVDLTTNTWLEEIDCESFDVLLAKPGGLTSPFKQLYDERIYILSKELKYEIFPSADEIFIYENKRFLSFWLKANKIPHPKTDVFYDIREAIDFVSKSKKIIVSAKSRRYLK